MAWNSHRSWARSFLRFECTTQCSCLQVYCPLWPQATPLVADTRLPTRCRCQNWLYYTIISARLPVVYSLPPLSQPSPPAASSQPRQEGPTSPPGRQRGSLLARVPQGDSTPLRRRRTARLLRERRKRTGVMPALFVLLNPPHIHSDLTIFNPRGLLLHWGKEPFSYDEIRQETV